MNLKNEINLFDPICVQSLHIRVVAVNLLVVKLYRTSEKEHITQTMEKEHDKSQDTNKDPRVCYVLNVVFKRGQMKFQ